LNSRTLRLALAAFPLWCTASLFIFNAPWRFRLIVMAVFGLSAAVPHVGLLALAAFVPLGHLFEAGLRLYPFRVTEAAVLAFFAGWLVRARPDRDGPRLPSTAVWLLAWVVCASVAAQVWIASRVPGELPENLQVLYQAYYLIPDRIGFGSAAMLLEGLGLMAATVALLRDRPQLAVTLPVVMTTSAVVAAASSVLLTKGIAFPQILEEQARLVVRTSAHVPDPNAAASYFGMMLFVALGMAMRRPRHILWVLAALAEIVGLALAASRTGVAAVAVGLVMIALCWSTAAWRPRTKAWAVAVTLAIVLAAGLVRAWTLRADPGAVFRQQFFATSLRMIADRPLTGVGIGRYYDQSTLYASPEISWIYPFENAHNFFLQVAGDIGLPGLVLLMAIVGSIGFDAARAIGHRPRDMRLVGCGAAAVTMIVTWLSGHPLLQREVAFSFWIVLGLLAALAGSVLIGTHERSREPVPLFGGRKSFALLAAAGVVALAGIGVGRHPARQPESRGVTGLDPWETAADGTRFRWTHEYASVFVPANATRVYIPVRLPFDLPRLLPMPGDVKVAGVPRDRAFVGTAWAVLNLELPPAPQGQRFKRIDLKVQQAWQPAVYLPGNGDLRRIGVQVGEIKEFYEY
jgi:O-antigen ligase